MKNKILSLIVMFVMFFTVINAMGEETTKSAMTVDDVLNIEYPYQLRISPDGKKLLWVQKHGDTEKNKYISSIWMSSLINNVKPFRLTKGDKSSLSPAWSPDGKSILFLSNREDDRTQIFTISPDGGEAEKLFSYEEDIEGFKWKDSKTVIFLARENKYYYEQQLEDAQDETEVVDDVNTYVPYRLFSYSLETKKIKRLTSNKDEISEFSISPDGKWAVTSHIDSPLYGLDPKYFKTYYLLNLKDLKTKQIFKDKYFAPYGFEWGQDGTLYMLEEKSNYEEKQGPGMPLLYEYDVKADIYKEIPLNWPNGIGTVEGRNLGVGGNIPATFLAAGVVNHFVLLNKSGGEWQINRIEDKMSSNFETFAISSDGKSLAFVYSTGSKPPKIYYASIEGKTLKNVFTVADLNKNLNDVSLARSEAINWDSGGGRKIEGMLYYPVDYKEGKKYPLIVAIHGGPSWYDGDTFGASSSWAYYNHILAGKNAFVLQPNYSGSINYGLPFIESIFGHYYELEVPDILAGVDYLISKGMVDPEKLATMGWSNGSILSIALTVETKRFKAACCGAGDVNWISDYGNCAFGVQFDNLYLKGPYWENLEYYISKSPLFKMKDVTTPTLIMFGDSDTSVPTGQGYEHYRALQQLGKVPVKFLLFPGEPHSLGKISSQKRKMKEEIAWLDKYLFNIKENKENRAFKEGSPLDINLKKEDFKYNELHQLGINHKNTLIPETVKYGGLSIGRFEVTRAQFGEFLQETKIDLNLPGWKDDRYKRNTDNYPVSGVDFKIAMKYCEWLSKKTGKKYRLPGPDEMGKWIEDASGEENNLDYWAGYNLTPDEAIELKEYIIKLEKGAGLILPCGFFSPSFDTIYDINGNISELCSDGSVKGLSVFHISDDREPYNPPGPDYTGFRVVVE